MEDTVQFQRLRAIYHILNVVCGISFEKDRLTCDDYDNICKQIERDYNYNHAVADGLMQMTLRLIAEAAEMQNR